MWRKHPAEAGTKEAMGSQLPSGQTHSRARANQQPVATGQGNHRTKAVPFKRSSTKYPPWSLQGTPEAQKSTITHHPRGHHTKRSTATSPLLRGSDSLPFSTGCCLWRATVTLWAPGITALWPAAGPELLLAPLTRKPKDRTLGLKQSSRTTALQGQCRGFVKFTFPGPPPRDSSSVGQGWGPGTHPVNKIPGHRQCPAQLGSLSSRELSEASFFSDLFSFVSLLIPCLQMQEEGRDGKHKKSQAEGKAV